MVMSGSRNPVDIYKLGWIFIVTYNYLLNIHPLVMGPFLKDFRYFQADLQDKISNQMKGSCLVSSFSCQPLELD